jgi:hypothetical protein
MYNPIAKIKSEKGMVLIAAYLVLIALIIFTTAFLNRGIYQNRSIIVFKKNTQAFDLAESGLNRAIYWLRAQPSPPSGNYNNPWGGGAQSLGSGTYSVAITDLGSLPSNPGLHRYKVVSTGTVDNIIRVLTNNIVTDNYARYIWFTDRETFGGTNVWFWSLDHLNGPTHTNTHYNIYGNPIFGGDVRSVDDYIRFYNHGNNINLSQTTNPPYDTPDFQGGMEFGAEQSNMPTQALSLRTASSATGGLRLQGDTTIILNANGTMNVTNSKKGWNNQNMPLPTNGALFVDTTNKGKEGNLTISGTLSGKLTVGAARDVNIPASIVYANDPRVNPSSTDTLGILAENDVVIQDNASTNLEIDASVMALQSSFMLENWDQGPPKGTLTVYGGIIQDQRGPVGTFNGATGQKLSGYSKNYSYDSRLLLDPPPFYPTTNDYVTISWED